MSAAAAATILGAVSGGLVGSDVSRDNGAAAVTDAVLKDSAIKDWTRKPENNHISIS
jgi:uncharacterized protein YcfJ